MILKKKFTIDKIIDSVKSYFPDANIDLINKAYDFALKAHKDQTRSSGEPFIIHPLGVAQIITELKLDVSSIVTGILHDTLEDTPVTVEEITELFGEEITALVDGVSKLTKITFRTSEEKQAENFRKMILAMAKDIRVILVKLADRLNNMRTLGHLPQDRQKKIAQETLDIYAPIANRLGISQFKIELEDLCLRHLHPEVYFKLAQQVAKTKKERERYIEKVCEIIIEKLKEYDIDATVTGRAKHFHSIYKKMDRRKLDFEQLHDLIAFRIVVDNITECYKSLGVIHAAYKPVPGRFKDYIAMPKANSYQSLHTTVIGPYGERVEIQIRTNDMHQIAERGIAAHWKYKEGKFESNKGDGFEWVNRLLEWQKDLSDPNEFLETVKIDLFEEDVFVFTPKGEVRVLTFNSTPLDFAYAIHTDVGNHCVGAKVNGKIVPLKHRLKSGDTVQIITSNSQTPSKDWLKIARSSRAKAKIRSFIKQQERKRSMQIGAELLERMLKNFKINLRKLEKSGELEKAARKVNFRTADELYIALGYGRINVDNVLKLLLPKEIFDKWIEDEKAKEPEGEEKLPFKKKKSVETKNAISVADLDDVLIRFGRCCSPLPGDSIVGFVTRGRGVTVHTANCPKAIDMDPHRKVDIKWNANTKNPIYRTVKIRILLQDEPGILATISQAITQCGINITSANINTTKDKKAIGLFDVIVKDVTQLDKVTSVLESKAGIISVERMRS